MHTAEPPVWLHGSTFLSPSTPSPSKTNFTNGGPLHSTIANGCLVNMFEYQARSNKFYLTDV